MIKSFQSYLISYNKTIVDVIKKFKQISFGCLVVIDDKGKLFGTITDGDIRKYIYNEKKLQTSIKQACNKKPKFLYKRNFSNKKLKT